MKKKKYNDCGKCSYYFKNYDYFGECNEWCRIHYDIVRKKCYYKMIIRKFLRLIWRIRERKAARMFMREEESRYKERVKLGMTEEEYEQYELT